jgi:uncharacterized protein YjiS (DUF1127 family)
MASMTSTTSNLRLEPTDVNVMRLVQRCYQPRPMLARVWRWAVARCARSRRQRVAAGELRGMSDRDLQDLGIGRCQVAHLLDRT